MIDDTINQLIQFNIVNINNYKNINLITHT